MNAIQKTDSLAPAVVDSIVDEVTAASVPLKLMGIMGSLAGLLLICAAMAACVAPLADITGRLSGKPTVIRLSSAFALVFPLIWLSAGVAVLLGGSSLFAAGCATTRFRSTRSMAALTTALRHQTRCMRCGSVALVAMAACVLLQLPRFLFYTQ